MIRVIPVTSHVEPEPSEAEREAILAALEEEERVPGAWAEAALLESVESGEQDP